MDVYLVTHATSVDNEAGIASGHRDPDLSPRGRAEAAALPARLAGVRFGPVWCSPLLRSVETARLAFADTHEIRSDARLSEVDYGDYTGIPVHDLDALCPQHVEIPFPNGESYRQRVTLVGAFLAQIRQEGPDGALLIVGHRATKWSLDVLLDNQALAEIVSQPLGWRAYWHYLSED